jgi:MFS family permease
MEVPTGAIADVLGRRRAMIASFAAYIAAFTIFGLSEIVGMLFAAMFLFSVGEAFRTGTHKAIIFDWLARQGRADERTAVYGCTRSWSKLGSAVSVVIAAATVFATGDYSTIFLFCIVPYAVNIGNFLTYPKYLDGQRSEGRRLGAVARTLLRALVASMRRSPLRRLLAESMTYEGVYKASKGAVYCLLHLLSSFASRRSGRFARGAGGEERAAHLLWWLDLLVFAGMAGGIVMGLSPVVIAAFVLLAVLQNFWRPILVGRVASYADPSQTATVLSIESQAKSLFVVAVAPLLGWAVDRVSSASYELRFVPVVVVGVAICVLMLLTAPGRRADRGQASSGGAPRASDACRQ